MEWDSGIKPVRRIVTGENGDGRSVIVSDGPTLNRFKAPFAPLYVQVPWATGEAAAKGDDPAPANHHFDFHSEGGSVLRIIDFPPDNKFNAGGMAEYLDEYKVKAKDNARHFGFHKTPTLDYAICLQGEIHALLDENETVMRAGDVLIQRATNHSWSNRSGQYCRMAFVLLALDAMA